MFVMLSVRTTATVRERPAETVKKAININQLIKNIHNRKQQQQQQQQIANKSAAEGLNNQLVSPADQQRKNRKNNRNNEEKQHSNKASADQKNLQQDKNNYQKTQGDKKIDKTTSIETIGVLAAKNKNSTKQQHSSPNVRLGQIQEEDSTSNSLSTVSETQQTKQQLETKQSEPLQQQTTVIIDVTTNSVSSSEKQDQQQQGTTNQNQTQPDRKSKTTFLLPELNNFKKPPTVQVPVATILNDLSPVPAPAKVTNQISNSKPMSPMNPAGLQSNSPDVKAMRYYRLWIYTCNAVLLMAVIVFCGVAGKILLSDYKRLLVNGLSLTQPSFIYAYLALLVQSGFLQLIGCLGALRLSEKLLNAYWLLLLLLLIGDAMLGIFWMFKFDKVMNDLQPMLKARLANEYGNSMELTELWDRLQNEGRCCGVSGPQMFSVLEYSHHRTQWLIIAVGCSVDSV
ncbi:transcription factor SPT20 homolog [Uranotaenia lowii]|uniref:transcription factor SPT20 homolog n=1 Tax=Uranotaenia lowii TaxID=190385 RepID=UPI00247ACB24|nr:transcription factor SPT20 homolog [Uranotaenia lowii]